MKSLVLLLSLIVFGISTEVSDGYKVGDTARDFSLKNTDGKMVSLKTHSGEKGAIVIFTCNTCPYSKAYEDRIIDLQSKYKDKGYPVIAIQPNDPARSPGDSFDNMKARAKEKGFNFPYLIDTTQEITTTYGATNTPHVYVLEKESGKFTVKYIGAIDNNSRDASSASEKYVEKAVDALLAGSEVEKTSTKAIGCTIKWSK